MPPSHSLLTHSPLTHSPLTHSPLTLPLSSHARITGCAKSCQNSDLFTSSSDRDC